MARKSYTDSHMPYFCLLCFLIMIFTDSSLQCTPLNLNEKTVYCGRRGRTYVEDREGGNWKALWPLDSVIAI